MAARYKSAFASASGFCSANAAQRIDASPAAAVKKTGVSEAAKGITATRAPARVLAQRAKRAA